MVHYTSHTSFYKGQQQGYFYKYRHKPTLLLFQSMRITTLIYWLVFNIESKTAQESLSRLDCRIYVMFATKLWKKE